MIYAYGTYYVKLLSLDSREVAHCLSTIPGIIQQRRRHDGQESHDAKTSVSVVVSPPLFTHIQMYYEAPLICCEWRDRVDSDYQHVLRIYPPHFILKTYLTFCGPTAVGA